LAKTSEETVSHERELQTNKDDRCRLVHLFALPDASTLWTKAYTPADRCTLDAKGMGQVWEDLATMFNDYDTYPFLNAVIEHTEDGVPIAPYRGVANLGRVCDECYMLKPSDRTRPRRNGEWVKATTKGLRSIISTANANFLKSGNQDAEHMLDEWCNFSQDFGPVCTYSRVIIKPELLDQMGKCLPLDHAIDTNGGNKRPLSMTTSAVNKRRQRSMESSPIKTQVVDYIAEAIRYTADLQAKQAALEVLSKQTTSKKLQKASLLQLATAAGLQFNFEEEEEDI
jgi:hypothetical protein